MGNKCYGDKLMFSPGGMLSLFSPGMWMCFVQWLTVAANALQNDEHAATIETMQKQKHINKCNRKMLQ